MWNCENQKKCEKKVYGKIRQNLTFLAKVNLYYNNTQWCSSFDPLRVNNIMTLLPSPPPAPDPKSPTKFLYHSFDVSKEQRIQTSYPRMVLWSNTPHTDEAHGSWHQYYMTWWRPSGSWAKITKTIFIWNKKKRSKPSSIIQYCSVFFLPNNVLSPIPIYKYK